MPALLMYSELANVEQLPRASYRKQVTAFSYSERDALLYVRLGPDKLQIIDSLVNVG